MEVFLADRTSKDPGGLSDRRWVNECVGSLASAFFLSSVGPAAAIRQQGQSGPVPLVAD
jgi:hypothetical protein